MAARELERIDRERDRQLRELPKQAEDEAVLRAREDPNAFIEYCFTDERGNSLRQAWHHREWQDLFALPAVVILGAAETGKTQQLAFRLTWNLGRNPELRWYIIGSSQSAAQKILGVAKRAIAKNERVRKVFPNLLPGDTWTKNEIMVQRRRLETKDYSVQAFGWDSEGILGTRADGIILDDINNLRNTRTEDSRKKINEQADSVLDSRLVNGGQLLVAANAWHPEDYAHTVGKRPGFVFKKYPIVKYENGVPVSTWPEQFPMERIAQIRARTTAIAFARMRMCQALSDETARFDEEWFEWAKDAGAGVPWAPPYLRDWPPELGGGQAFFFGGVDLASGKRGRKRKTDTSSIAVWAYHPRTYRFCLVDLQTGRWKAPEILSRMRALTLRYDPLWAVEDNGVQQMLIDIALAEPTPQNDEDRRERPAMKVIGLTTTSGKWEPETGIEGMAIDFEQRRIVIPSEARTLRVAEPVVNLLHGLLHFSPLEHTPDDVMALWIGWTAARKYHRNPFDTKATVLG